MSLKKYLKDHRLHLLLGLLAEGVVEAVLWLFASPVALQGFAFFWLTGSIGVIFGYDFLSHSGQSRILCILTSLIITIS